MYQRSYCEHGLSKLLKQTRTSIYVESGMEVEKGEGK